MTTFTTYTPDNAPAASKASLEDAKAAFGFVPNLQATMAESPELLAGYSALWDLVAKTSLTPHEQQVVSLTDARLKALHRYTGWWCASAAGSPTRLYPPQRTRGEPRSVSPVTSYAWEPRMIRISTGALTALAGPRLEQLAWLFLTAAALGLFCDHAAHAVCAPPAGLSYEVSRVRRETMRELVALPDYRMDGRWSALV